MLQTLRTIALISIGLFLPIEYLTLFDLGNLTITPTKVVGALAIAVGAIHILAGWRPAPAGLHAWLSLYVFSIGVGTVVTVWSGIRLVDMIPSLVTVVSLILLYFILAMIATEERSLDILARSMAVGSAFVSATALLGYGVTVEGETARSGGFGGNPNELGFNLCIALAVTLGCLPRARSLFARLFLLGCAALAIGALVASLSRSAFLALIVMWIYLILSLRRFDLLKYTLPAGAAVLIGALVFSPEVRDRIGTLQGSTRNDGSVVARVVTNRHAVDAFLTSPLVGVGYRYFTFWTAKEGRGLQTGNVVHGSFLAVAAEGGILGLVPFVAMHFAAWRYFGRARRLAERSRHRNERTLRALRSHAIALQVALIGACVGGLFHPASEYKALWVLMGLSPAVLAATRKRVDLLERSEAPVEVAPSEAELVPWHLNAPPSFGRPAS